MINLHELIYSLGLACTLILALMVLACALFGVVFIVMSEFGTMMGYISVCVMAVIVPIVASFIYDP